MSTPEDNPLADTAFMTAVLDTMVPPCPPKPGAGAPELGLVATLREQLEGNALLGGPFRDALAALRDAATARDPGGLQALAPEAREALMHALLPTQPLLGMFPAFVFTGYYQHPEVLRAMGERGQPPYPEGHTIDATAESLLTKLGARTRDGGT